MIIECPACTTRYDIKAQIPPAGRTVRCAKCGTVWRALPDNNEDEAGLPAQRSAKEQNNTAVPTEAGAKETISETRQDLWARGPYEGQPGEAAEAESSGLGDPLAESAYPQAPAARSHFEAGKGKEEEQDSSGKVSWFSGFRRKSNSRPVYSQEMETAPSPARGAETIPFPRSGPAAQNEGAKEEELRTLEEAREAVRGVFSSLGEIRPGSGRAAQAPEEEDQGGTNNQNGAQISFAASRAEHQETAGFSSWARDAGFETRQTEGEVGFSSSLGTEEPAAAEEEGAPSAEENSANPWAARRNGLASDEADPGEGLRSAMRAHFAEPSTSGELARRLETHFRPGSPDDAEEDEQEERRSQPAAIWKMPAPADDDAPQGATLPDDDNADGRDDELSIDQRLFREIEETREYAEHPARRVRRGGLAIAAGWGLFICIAAGLSVGFVAFRDITAEALPGLAPVYRAMGLPVTIQPLVFEGVQYKWSISDNKPVLVINGTVFNRAHRKVRVPEFYVTIKDEDPALDREYNANLQVNASKIKAGERADFEIELLAPNPTISAVELELRKVR